MERCKEFSVVERLRSLKRVLLSCLFKEGYILVLMGQNCSTLFEGGLFLRLLRLYFFMSSFSS